MEVSKKEILILLFVLITGIYSFSPESSPSSLSLFGILTPTTLVLITALGAVYHFVFPIFFSPLWKPLSQTPPPLKPADAINRTRLEGAMPPYYPNGWYKILDSHELTPKGVRSISFLGLTLVAFRGEDGQVAVLDAYCPHLGAHLGGGKVVGNCVECPFHGWTFDVEGRCSNVPYSDKAPDFVKIASWPVCERNKMIHIWYHSERKPPTYEIAVYSEMDGGSFLFHGKSQHLVSAHIQEIPENGADVAHLNFLHVPFLLTKLSPPISHSWSASWAPGEGEEAHVGKMNLTHQLLFLGRTVPGTLVNVRINQIGPSLVYLEFFLPVGKCIIVESVTPAGPFLQHCEHVVYAEWKLPRIIAKMVLQSTIIQFERDIPIWNIKAFLPKPILVKGDGKISQFRRWFSQFYTKNEDGSIKKNGSLDW